MSETNAVKDESERNEVERLQPVVMVQKDALERWELFRCEMQIHQDRLAKLAGSYLELGAFDDAAKCAIKADGIKYVIGRMPALAP